MPNLKFDLKKSTKLKLDLRMKLTGIASLCFVFIVLWFVVISNYQSGKSSSTISQGELLQTAFKGKYQYLVDLQDAAKKTDAAQKITTQIYEKVLPLDNSTSPIDDITELGNEEKLKFVFFKPKPVQSYPDYRVTPMDVSLYGSFDGLIRFMDKLTQANGTIIIDDFVIMRRSDDPNDIIMNATLNVYNGISEENKEAAIETANPTAPKTIVSKVNKNVS